MAIYNNILECVGRTPVISLKGLLPSDMADVYVKMEGFNPAGSIKDRPALHIIRQAEKNGLLKPDGTIVESTSGNLGVALAMVSAVLGYECIIVVDPRTSHSNIAAIEAFGATIDMVTSINPSDGTYQEARIDRAKYLATTIEGAFMPYQYGNPHNPQAHSKSTAKEIMMDFPNGPDVLVTAVSTGGHISGISSELKRSGCKTKTVGVDVRGSVVFGGNKAPTAVTGMGLGWVPENLNPSVIDEAFLVDTQQCFSLVRYIARNKGILLGGSSGASLFVAINQAYREGAGKTVLAVSADRGEKYLNEIYDNKWMLKKGLTIDSNISEMISQAKAMKPFRYPSLETDKGVAA